jgi:hypothetical protein
LLYTSQNLLGTIFRVAFAVLYKRIWSIVGKYSILCCDTQKSGAAARDSKVEGRVVCGAGRLPWPPACPICPIDLRARLVRVKQALTGGHGKSDLLCPRWLPHGPPRRRGSRRRCVAGRGRNGAYGTSGADTMARTGCRALTLWATTGRRARTGRTDERGHRLRKQFYGRGRKRQVRVCGRGRFGQYSYVGTDATTCIVMRART